MSEIIINLVSGRCCPVSHTGWGKGVPDTSLPGGGQMSSLSSANMLATSLGSCLAANLQTVADKGDFSLREMTIAITKQLSLKPQQNSRMEVEITLPLPLDGKVQRSLERAIRSCSVSNKLPPDTDIKISFKI